MDRATLSKVAKVVKATTGERYTTGVSTYIRGPHKRAGVYVTWSHDHVSVEWGGYYLGDIPPELGTPECVEYWQGVIDIMAPAKEALEAEGYKVEGDSRLSINKPYRKPIDLGALLG